MLGSLGLIVLAGLLGPLLAAGKRPIAPVLLGELIAGIVIGKSGFHLIDATAQPFPIFSTLGFAMLMLTAGTEVDIGSPQLRQAARPAGFAFALTLLVGVPVGVAISALLGVDHSKLLIVLLAGSSAAVAFPTIEERGLSGPGIALLMAWITLADAVTALLMPLTLSGASRLPAALAGDALIIAVAAGAVAAGHRLFRTGVADAAKHESKTRHWALQLRLSVLLLLALGAIAERTGASLLIAGFAAGIVLRQFRGPHRLTQQLAGLATGFFVPAFFVLLGATLDMKSLIQEPAAIGLAVAMALGATTVHLLSAVIATKEWRLASGLLASAQLGLPAAAAALGLGSGTLRPPVAAALVAGGCLTLIPATMGAILLARNGVGSSAPAATN